MVVTPGVRESYRLEAGRRSWGEDWPAIGAGVLAEVLDNPAGRPGRPEEAADKLGEAGQHGRIPAPRMTVLRTPAGKI